MPDISLSPPAVQALQRLLRAADYEAPDDIESPEEYHERTGRVEDYEHEVAEETALDTVLNACPVCGDPECNRGTAYVGSTMIHRDKHPEMKTERAMDNRGHR
jgi:hypothetical protein